MGRSEIHWLDGELPSLVEKGVLSADAAERLRAHYGAVGPVRPARLAIAVFGALGALLIGAGIILLLAHNWESLTRPMRAALSFLPLLLTQGFAAWVLVRRATSLAWREGTSSLVFLMIGASISLMAQTYNISGDLPRFILTWSLLGLPLVYLFDALVPALLYLWGITEWACHVRCEDGFSAGYWLLLALALPHARRWLAEGRYRTRSTLFLWGVCVSVTVAAGVTVERVLPGIWIFLYSGLFALLFLAGERWFCEGGGFWARPLRHFGAGGLLVLIFLLTFEWPWREIGWHHWHWNGLHAREISWRVIPDAVLGSVIPFSAVVLFAREVVRRKTVLALLLGAVPVLAAAGFCVASLTETYAPSAGLFDAYLLVVGLWLLGSGLREGKQGQMNVGLVALSALAVARFFDSDLSFLLRGLVFIALGIAFLVANVVMLRLKGGCDEHA